MIQFEKVRDQLSDRALIRSVDLMPRGHIRLETGLVYPDGASIDVFLVNDEPILSGANATTHQRLSDLGQTTAWLLDMQVKPWLSKKRRSFIEDVLHIHKVNQVGGELTVDVPPGTDLMGPVLRLAQACLRVADLTFTRRASLASEFQEDLEEVLADSELPYVPDADIPGRHGQLIRVSYLVAGKTQESAVMALSASNPYAAHAVANEIFRRWHALDVPGNKYQKVTVYDDRKEYRSEDLRDLNDLSTLVSFSEKETLITLLAA